MPKLEQHRKQQDTFRAQFGPDYQADLDLVLANLDGSPLKPDSTSATISLLFKRVGIAKPKGGSPHHGVADAGQRLGHSSVRTTLDICSHALAGADEEAVAQWGACQARNRAAGQGTSGGA
jgi:hypothetical protein